MQLHRCSITHRLSPVFSYSVTLILALLDLVLVRSLEVSSSYLLSYSVSSARNSIGVQLVVGVMPNSALSCATCRRDQSTKVLTKSRVLSKRTLPAAWVKGTSVTTTTPIRCIRHRSCFWVRRFLPLLFHDLTNAYRKDVQTFSAKTFCASYAS